MLTCDDLTSMVCFYRIMGSGVFNGSVIFIIYSLSLFFIGFHFG